ncbi:MAG: hypothetical protein OXG53_06660 [Chloroflexi bacterium]|nr:hypothetical protein [Chloroflexota bacterium]
MTETKRAEEILKDIYEEALGIHDLNGACPPLSDEDQDTLNVFRKYFGERLSGLNVLVTLLLKKVQSPDQDIRRHQAQIQGGFAGRPLDTKVVAPFLKEMQFPSASESGWTTRTFEHEHPYTFDYPGNISPAELKHTFLRLVNSAQCRGHEYAHAMLLNILVLLIEMREKDRSLVLSRPVNLTVADVVRMLKQHHDVETSGVARLPVLSVNAILTVLVGEADRYRGCRILPLESHTSADSRSHLIGDVNILDGDGRFFEGYEIKHNVRITSNVIQNSFLKLRTTTVDRYYILTTYPHDDYREFDDDVLQIAKTHGCQMIINGVDKTLAYYLRLIEDTKSFIDIYVSHLESDPALNYQIRERWNDIVLNR